MGIIRDTDGYLRMWAVSVLMVAGIVVMPLAVAYAAWSWTGGGGC